MQPHNPTLMQDLATKRAELMARIARNAIKEHATQIELVSFDGVPHLPYSLLMSGFAFDRLHLGFRGSYTVYLHVAGKEIFCGQWSLASEFDCELLLSFIKYDFDNAVEALS